MDEPELAAKLLLSNPNASYAVDMPECMPNGFNPPNPSCGYNMLGLGKTNGNCELAFLELDALPLSVDFRDLDLESPAAAAPRLFISSEENPGSPKPAKLANMLPPVILPNKLGMLLKELRSGLFLGSKLLRLDSNLGSNVFSSLGSKPVKFESVAAKVFGSKALKLDRLAKRAGFSPATF